MNKCLIFEIIMNYIKYLENIQVLWYNYIERLNKKPKGLIFIKKTAFVINGAGGVGKDTLCSFASKHYKTVNVSSVDPIKRIASENGWQGEKNAGARRFLSELKRVFTEYNDLPLNYTLDVYRKFLTDDSELFFVHIREPKEIQRFIENASSIGGSVLSLLIRSERCEKNYGNASDDEVEEYPYDLIYQNDSPLEETELNFLEFLKNVRKNQNAN